MDGRVTDWAAWLNEGIDKKTINRKCQTSKTGRPCGEKAFVLAFEEKPERILTPQKPGPKPRHRDLLTEDLIS